MRDDRWRWQEIRMDVFAAEFASRTLSSLRDHSDMINVFTDVVSDAAGLAHGQLADSYYSRKRSRGRVRSLLSSEYAEMWRDRLWDLNLLLRESLGDDLEALIYRSGDYLLCEIGPAGRTLLLSVDEDGSTLTYREHEGGGEYVRVSWDTLPPLVEFQLALAHYRQADRAEWSKITSMKTTFLPSPKTRSWGDDFDLTPVNPSSTKETEMFAY